MGELTIAKSAGFCFGVTRAVNMVYEAIEKENVPIYTYGPIIHNDEVVKDMEKNGVTVINDLDELSSHEKGVMIIRSHGISKAEYDRIKNCGFEVLNATCPFVSKIHRYVEDYSSKGYDIIIVGSPKHPEVCGIKGWADEKCHVTIINSPEDAKNYMKNSTKKLCIVSQTTFNYNKFQDIVEIIAKKGYDITVLNTICNATEVRQTEARKVAQCSDVMIVIGDRHSSNTQKLFEICKNECKNTYYIQTSDEMDYTQIRSNNNVGITAGASTPNNIIEEVSKNVRNLSITGVCALILCYILEAAGVSGQNSFFEKLYLYCETLVPVTITMIVFYSTGLINKLHRKNRSSVLDNFPKAIRIIITAVLAFAVAALLKLFLSNVLGL